MRADRSAAAVARGVDGRDSRHADRSRAEPAPQMRARDASRNAASLDTRRAPRQEGLDQDGAAPRPSGCRGCADRTALRVEIADRGAVAAFHVVGEDFQLRLGVDRGAPAQQQMLVHLLRVGLLRVGRTSMRPWNTPCARSVEHALEELARGAVRRRVIDDGGGRRVLRRRAEDRRRRAAQRASGAGEARHGCRGATGAPPSVKREAVVGARRASSATRASARWMRVAVFVLQPDMRQRRRRRATRYARSTGVGPVGAVAGARSRSGARWLPAPSSDDVARMERRGARPRRRDGRSRPAGRAPRPARARARSRRRRARH